MSESIRILIADDHLVVRRGLRSMLVPRHGMEVVGEASNGREAVEMARSLRPDVILMDLLMPELSGSQAIAEIVRQDPEARILVLTSFGAADQVSAALQAGALGYLLKDSSAEELLQAIRSVHLGNLSLPGPLASAWMRGLRAPPASRPAPDALTRRERDVLRGIARGLTNREIARELQIGVNTVRTHVSSILGKLGLSSRTQAARYALERGLISSGDDAR